MGDGEEVGLLIAFLVFVALFSAAIGHNTCKEDLLNEMLKNKDITQEIYEKYMYA